MDRRRFLHNSAIISVVALAGCSSDSSSDDGSNSEDTGPSGLVDESGSENGREDEWYQWEGDDMTLDGNFTVDPGPNVDVFVLEAAQFERYRTAIRSRLWASRSMTPAKQISMIVSGPGSDISL